MRDEEGFAEVQKAEFGAKRRRLEGLLLSEELERESSGKRSNRGGRKVGNGGGGELPFNGIVSQRLIGTVTVPGARAYL